VLFPETNIVVADIITLLYVEVVYINAFYVFISGHISGLFLFLASQDFYIFRFSFLHSMYTHSITFHNSPTVHVFSMSQDLANKKYIAHGEVSLCISPLGFCLIH
jgi:hypothetical protein